MAELADALRSGRSEPWAHEGSNPSFGTNPTFDGVFCYETDKNKNGTIVITIPFDVWDSCLNEKNL